MPAHPPGFTTPRGACALAMVGLAFVLAGCAKVPVVGGKPMVTLELTSVPKANSCGEDVGNSITFRLLQVTDASAVTGASLTQLWDREDKLLGPAFLEKHEGVIDPGRKAEFKYERNEKAKAVVFVGSFCKPQSSCWYYTRPLSKGSTLKLTIDESCVRVTKK